MLSLFEHEKICLTSGPGSLLVAYNPNTPFLMAWLKYITKTYLYHFDPLKPHFYIVKLGFTGVYIIFLISA